MAIGLNHYQISWTKLALKDIRKVYKFYSRIASPEIAKKIIFPIFAKVKTLSKKPLIGQLEENLLHLNRGHRYLVCKHLKIIYIFENNIVFITHVFDTRQNPVKLK